MTSPIRIVIVGNGFGGVYTLKNLHKFFHDNKKDKKLEITLVGEKNYFLFTPLLHEVATGGINPSNIIEPIRKILGCCLDRFYLGKTKTINLKDRTVAVENNVIPYDYLILAPGSETNFYGTPGGKEHAFELKSIEDAVKIKNHCTTQMERAMHVKDRTERKKILKFVVIGGGPTGVELVAELAELIKDTFSRYYPEDVIEDTSILLIQKASELVPAFSPKIRAKSLAVLQRKGVEVMLESTVTEVASSYVALEGNLKIFTETVIWVAGIKPAEVQFNEEVEKSPDGRLVVNEYLQMKNHENVFALGDAALFLQTNEKNLSTPLPALAQVAEKESVNVAQNIMLLMNNRKKIAFKYKSSGNLLSLGQWMATGEIFGLTFSGYFAWWLWRTVYLSKLISWRKKVRVAIDWTMNIFSPRDISEL